MGQNFWLIRNRLLKGYLPNSRWWFFLAGETNTGISGDKTTNKIGTADIWLIKIDAAGNKLWDKSFGFYQQFNFPQHLSTVQKIIKTNDNNYLIAGKQEISSPSSQTKYWLIKIDDDGNELWSKTFEGSASYTNNLKTVLLLPDGYLLGGDSAADIGNNKTENSKGGNDFWILKLDFNGNKIWDKTIGGTSIDYLNDIVRLSNGSFLLGGHSFSGIGADKTYSNLGYNDFWLVKIDANGNKLWDRRYGGADMDEMRKIIPISDNSFLLAGTSTSGQTGNKSSASKGYLDFWVVKIDSLGNKIWDKSFGGESYDELTNGIKLSDGGILLYGDTPSSGSDFSQPSKGGSDYWLLKIDTDGNKVWDRRFGSTGQDFKTGALYQIDDKNLIIGGSSYGIGADKTEDKYSYNGSDFWLLKLYACEELQSSASIDAGTSINLIASGCQGTFIWSTTQTTNMITVAPQLTTTYMASCTIGGTCVKQSSVQINVNCGNNFSLSGKDSNGGISSDPVVCSGRPSMTLIATGCSGTVTWQGGATGTSFVVSPTTTGTFSATCSGSSCTEATKNIVVTVSAPPTISAPSTVACVGNSIILTASTNIIGGTIQWYKNETSIIDANSLTYNANATGTYTVGVSKNGCQAISTGTSITINNTIPPKPTISASTLFVCGRGYGTTLTASNCSGTVTWQTDKDFYSPQEGEYVRTSSNNPLSAYIYYQTKFYTSCTVNTCISPVSDTLVVDYSRIKVTSPDNILCANGQIQLTAAPYPSTGITSYIWYKGGSQISENTSNTLTINSPGTYGVVAVYTNGCQPFSGSSGGGGSLIVQGTDDLPVPAISGLSSASSGLAVKVWDKRFGSSGNDYPASSLATPNHGILVGGTSDQTIDGDKSGVNRGRNDYWLIKVDSSGNKIWDKSYGSTGNETLQKIVGSSDKGYLLAGSSTSSPTDINGDKTQGNKTNDSDFWIVKIDSSGNKLWDNVYGGDGTDGLTDAIRTSDKGYLLAGVTSSSASFDVSEFPRGSGYEVDYWIIKIDSMGNKLWNKRFGGIGEDNLKKIVEVNDGGYILGGHSNSGISGDKSTGNSPYPSVWLVKINANGNKVWDKAFGGGINMYFTTMIPTSDGGQVVSGSDTTKRVFKLDAGGNKQWEKTYKIGSSTGNGDMLENTTGFLIGESVYEVLTQPTQGESDYLIIQTDKNGNKLWDRRFGGSMYENFGSLVPINTGYYLIGSSTSPISGDKTQPRRGNTATDYWVVKTTTNTPIATPYVVTSGITFNLIASNCAGTVTWSGGATGIGPMLKVTQTTPKTYIATCNAYGCSKTSSVLVGMDLCGNIVDLSITDPITTGSSASPVIKMVQSKITATNSIGSSSVNASAKYVAGNSITLNPGFKIESGSIFQTKVSPGCN